MQTVERRGERQSNMELLRIVAMSMILIGHFLCHAITVKSMPKFQYDLIYTFCRDGVNLFFLISGYFAIKSPVRGVAKLVFTMLIFGLFNYILLYMVGKPVDLQAWKNLFFYPVSRSPYWFLKVYLFLIVCSPVINKGLERLTLTQLRKFMLLFTLVNLYSCWKGHNMVNTIGYSFVQGLYMYCLAAYFRRDRLLTYKLRGLRSLIPAVVLLLAGAIAQYYSKTDWVMNNNGFFNIVSSALLFIYIANLDIRSRAINIIATGALGCYLLQDGFFGHQYLYAHIHQVYTSEALFYSIGYMAAVFVLYWVCSLFISKGVTLSFGLVDRFALKPVTKKLGDLVAKIPQH